MKRSIYIFLSTTALLSLLIFCPVVAQEPPHPPSIGHGATGNQEPSSSAPLDGGIGLLLALGIAYGSRKAIKNNRNSSPEK